MSRNWSREELAAALARNPGLRVAAQPLERVANRQPPKVAKEPDLRRAVQTAHEIPPTAQNRAPNFVHELMACPSYQGNLQAEERLSYMVAAELRRLTHAGKLRAVWSRVPIEHPEGGRYGVLAQSKRVALGAIPGVPDFGFWWGTGSGFVELKVEGAQASLLTPSGKAGLRKGRRTYLRGRQRLFAAWAGQYGVHCVVCRSVPEVVVALKQWGVLDG